MLLRDIKREGYEFVKLLDKKDPTDKAILKLAEEKVITVDVVELKNKHA